MQRKKQRNKKNKVYVVRRLAKRQCNAPDGTINCGELWRLVTCTATGRRIKTVCPQGHATKGKRAELVNKWPLKRAA